MSMNRTGKLLAPRLIVLLAVSIGVSVAIPSRASGDSATLPPKILRIHREYILPGKDADYEGAASSAAKACAQSNCPSGYVGLKSLTGPHQAWSVSWFDSYEGIEQSEASVSDAMASAAEQKGPLIARPETLFAEYLPSLSYGSSTSLPAAHYWWIEIVRVLPGHGQDFESFRRLEREADARAQTGSTYYIYHVTSGGAGNLYLVITLARSLQEADALGQVREERRHGPSQDEPSRLVAASVARTEGYLFAADPNASYLPETWISADSSFWAAAAVKQ